MDNAAAWRQWFHVPDPDTQHELTTWVRGLKRRSPGYAGWAVKMGRARGVVRGWLGGKRKEGDGPGGGKLTVVFRDGSWMGFWKGEGGGGVDVEVWG